MPSSPPQRVLTHRDLPQRGGPVTGRGEAAHQQLVVALLQRIARHRPRRVRHRRASLPARQQRQRHLP
jgi:hypothetical protein